MPCVLHSLCFTFPVFYIPCVLHSLCFTFSVFYIPWCVYVNTYWIVHKFFFLLYRKAIYCINIVLSPWRKLMYDSFFCFVWSNEWFYLYNVTYWEYSFVHNNTNLRDRNTGKYNTNPLKIYIFRLNIRDMRVIDVVIHRWLKLFNTLQFFHVFNHNSILKNISHGNRCFVLYVI
jgi:hypothetical protein